MFFENLGEDDLIKLSSATKQSITTHKGFYR